MHEMAKNEEVYEDERIRVVNKKGDELQMMLKKE